MLSKYSLGSAFLALSLLAGQAFATPTLNNSQAADGLKALLEQGSDLAIRQLGQNGGFSQNPKWHIPLPSSLQKPAKLMRTLGQGAMVDELENNLNSAAEQAVPHARDLLVSSIRQMTLQDARQILSGSPTAATEYLNRTSRDQLREKFLPIVRETTAGSPLIQQYNQLAGQASGLGLSKKQSLSAEDYVTDKALDALFGVIGEQEAQLRANPAQATGNLLKNVLEAFHQ
ncbi:MAG: DUF4197 domain-containing protein [Thiopseudomonas sp.]